MTTIAMAWELFLASWLPSPRRKRFTFLARTLPRFKTSLEHARELLDVIADEIALTGASLPEWTRSGLDHLRERLTAVETALIGKH